MPPAPRSRGPAPTVPPEEYAAFCDAARRYAALRPWTTMAEEPVAVIFPGDPEPDFAIALGVTGEFVGMGLLRGLASLSWLLLVHAGDGEDDDVRAELDEVAFSMGPAADLTPWDRAQRKASGMKARRGEAVPSVMVKRPGLMDTTPTATEIRRLTAAADAFATAYAAGQIGSTDTADATRWTLVLPAGAGPARVEMRTFVPPRRVESPPVAPPASLRSARRTKGEWIAAMRTLTASIQGDDRALRVLLLIDVRSGAIVGNTVVAGIEPADAAHAFWSMLTESPLRGLPAHVTLTNRRLCESVSAGLATLGVEVAYAPAIPGVDEMLDELAAFISSGPARGPRPAR